MKKTILLLTIIYSLNQVTAKESIFKTKEASFMEASSVFLIKNDSLIGVKYKKVFDLINDEKNYTKGLNEALKLLEECKKNDNQYWIYKCSFLLGEVYRKTKGFEKSLEYYESALAKFDLNPLEQNDNRFTDLEYADNLVKVGTSYHNLSRNIVLDKIKNLDEFDSLELVNKKKKYIDKALYFYERVENLAGFNPELEGKKGTVFTNISTIYEQDSSFVNAEYYINKAIKIHKKNNNNLKTATALNNLGNIFLSQKQYQKSKDIYLEGLDLIKHNNNQNVNIIKASLYYNLGWAMRNLEEFEAYDFQEKFYEIEDENRDREFRVIIDEITLKHDVAKVREQEENIRYRAQRVYLLIGILALSIIITLVYILKSKNLKQKNLALELSQTELIQNKNLDRLKSETQVRILNATIDGKESERKQIAETLHDSVSALLSSANLHLQATRKQFNGSTPVEIDKTQKIILEASHKIRDLSHTLVSSILLKFGLDFAIRDIAEKYSNSALKIDVEINGIKRYHQDFEIKAYNIIQEFINNILKHSQATNALVELKEENKRLFLVISDDGVGFDKTKINMKDGLGINQIDARIQMMKGKFLIESSFNNGTIIFVELPVLEKEELNYA